MTEVPPFLFIVTSTALVLGVAITVRGLLGFRAVPEGAALPAPGTDIEPADPDAVPAPVVATGVRDLREPIVMTLVGALICMFTLLGISTLVNSA